MSVDRPAPGFRAAVRLAVIVFCAPIATSLRAELAGSTPSGEPTWLVKLTPVYGRALDAIEIRYRHHPKPFRLCVGTAREQMIRPTIRLVSPTGEGWLGLDADLAWEGRCSVAGRWVVIDADRSGPGLSTPNLRYDLESRRLLITSGSSRVIIDLRSGSVEGPSAMIGRCTDLRDHFLSHGNRPFCVKVSDRAGCSGMVWVFADLASVAVGPADHEWFARSQETEGRAPSLSWPELPASRPASESTIDPTPPLLAPPPEPAPRDQSPCRTKWAFGSETFRAVASSAAPAVRPKRLSSWPGKDLPPRPRIAATDAEAAQADRLLAALSGRWRGRADWVRRVVEAAERVRVALKGDPVSEASVTRRARSMAEGCGFDDAGFKLGAKPQPIGEARRVAVLGGCLRRLDGAMQKALTDARRSIETARGLTRQASSLAEAEQNCRPLAIGTSLADEGVCLMMDLAAGDDPLPDRQQIAAKLAQRLFTRVRDDVWAEVWNRADVLTLAPVPCGLDRPWGQVPIAIDGETLTAPRVDRAAERALSALGSAIYADPLAARHFQRHLAGRFPNPFEISPMDVAALVEDLAEGGVLVPKGLDQFVAMCGGARQERHELLTEALVAVRACWRMAQHAEDLIDRSITWRSTRQATVQQLAETRQASYAEQQAEVLALLRWVCETYADQLFGRADLTPPARKRRVLSTAAWWVRQWRMDLCWVAADFEVEVKRHGHLYAWRVYDLRIDLLDRPDPEAVVEERLARTPPPRAFPLGPIRAAADRTIVPRTLADLPEVVTVEQPVEAVASAPAPSIPTRSTNDARDKAARMILPALPGAILASDETVVVDSPPARPSPSPSTRPTVAPPTAPVGPPRPPTTKPAPATRVEAEPTVPGGELRVPVLLRPRIPGDRSGIRHLSTRPGQLVVLMGTAEIAPGREGSARLHVDLYADDPAADGLEVATSPRDRNPRPASLVDLPSGRWRRQVIQWPTAPQASSRSPADAAQSFTVAFRALAPTRPSETLTFVLTLVADQAGRDGQTLDERTYIFHLGASPTSGHNR